MTIEKLPRLVIIVSNGPLMVGRPEQLAGRFTITAPIVSQVLPLFAITTTVATGFDATIHGVVTKSTVDPDTLKVRPTAYSDRRLPAFWSGGAQAGIQTALVDWPTSEGDPDISGGFGSSSIDTLVEQSSSIDESIIESFGLEEDRLNALALNILERDGVSLTEAKNLIIAENPPHILGVALRNPLLGDAPQCVTDYIQGELESFLSLLTEETNVLIVHRKTITEDADDRFPLEATFLIEGCGHETKPPLRFEAIGGAAYVLAKMPCPMGVLLPKFSFLETTDESEPSRAFPAHVSKDETDWLAVVDQLLDRRESGPEQSNKAISILIKQFAVMAEISYRENRWKKLEQYSNYLMKLRGRTGDYWFKIIALHQQNKLEEIPEAVDRLTQRFPNLIVSSIAKSLLLIDGSPDEAKLLLEDIDPTEIHIASSLGTFGRLSIRADLLEQGVQALQIAIQKGIELPADRAVLAQVYLTQTDFESAIRAMGRIGLTGGDLSWRLLRLRILVALGQPDEAKLLATSINEQFPSNPEVRTILEGN